MQVLARIGRGALVGLPAIGALFVAHLAHQDWHRLQEERGNGESQGMAACLIALLCALLTALLCALSNALLCAVLTALLAALLCGK